MSAPITFSLIHATIRLPDGWVSAAQAWMESCDHPEHVEYILCIDLCDKWHWDAIPKVMGKPDRVVINYGRRCSIDAYNTAAEHATEKVLLVVSDDFYPPPHWDTDIANAIGDPSEERAVWLETEHGYIMTNPCITRAYYEKPGRGGCGGKLFHPDYMSYGADDDFTEVANRDGVVVRPGIQCEHRHWTRGLAVMDEAYSHTARMGGDKDEIFARRKAANFR